MARATKTAPPVVGSGAAPTRGGAQTLKGQLSPNMVLAAVWAAGSIVWLVIAGVRIIRFHRAVNRAAAADSRIGEMAAEVASRLGYRRPVRVRIFDPADFPPLLWALGHARIVLPEFAVADLTTAATDRHLARVEIAHLVRRQLGPLVRVCRLRLLLVESHRVVGAKRTASRGRASLRRPRR